MPFYSFFHNRCLCHCWIASLPGLTGCRGLWNLKPIIRSIRQTWPGWYLIPKRLLISSATRWTVQRSVENPCVRGPSRRILDSFSRCFCWSLTGLPRWGLAFRPSLPLSWYACFQRVTELGAAPIITATLQTPHPSSSSFIARYRRLSNCCEFTFGLTYSLSTNPCFFL